MFHRETLGDIIINILSDIMRYESIGAAVNVVLAGTKREVTMALKEGTNYGI